MKRRKQKPDKINISICLQINISEVILRIIRKMWTTGVLFTPCLWENGEFSSTPLWITLNTLNYSDFLCPLWEEVISPVQASLVRWGGICHQSAVDFVSHIWTNWGWHLFKSSMRLVTSYQKTSDSSQNWSTWLRLSILLRDFPLVSRQVM